MNDSGNGAAGTGPSHDLETFSQIDLLVLLDYVLQHVPVPRPVASIVTHHGQRTVPLSAVIQSPEVVQYLNSQPPFRIALAPNGARLAAVVVDPTTKHLQVEIREASSHFSKAVATGLPPKDDHFNWQRLVWSEEGDILALSASDGTILVFNLNGAVIHHLEVAEFSLHAGVVDMFFHTWADTSDSWTELFVLTYDRGVRRFLVPWTSQFAVEERDMILNVTQHHSMATSMTYSKQTRTVAIAGGQGSTGAVLSFWRFYNKEPYWYLLSPELEQPGEAHSETKGPARPPDPPLVRAVFEPYIGRMLAVVSVNGDLVLWDSRNRKRINTWTSESLDRLADPLNPAKPDEIRIRDVSWWNEETVILARANGSVVLLSPLGILHRSTDLKLLEGSARVHFPGASVAATQAWDKQFFLLTWETNAPTSRQQDQLVGSTASGPTGVLRLSAVRRSSPLEIFRAKVLAGEWGTALKIAKQHGLNPDLVYQTRWFSSPLSDHSIADFLGKVSDRFWVLRECKERIGTTYEENKVLLDTGLRFAIPPRLAEQINRARSGSVAASASIGNSTSGAASEAEAVASFLAEPLTPEDRSLLLHRFILLQYVDRLRSYNKIAEGAGGFEQQAYLHFRSAHLINQAAKYAKDGKIEALKALFTYHPEVLPWRLYILSQIPETSPPDTFAEVLPALNEDEPDLEALWPSTPWRSSKDWIESPSALSKLVSLPTAELGGVNDLSHALQLFPQAEALRLKLPAMASAPAQPLRPANFPELYAPLAEPSASLDKSILRTPFFSGQPLQPRHPQTSECCRRWFRARSLVIESTTGLVDNATALVELAISLGFPGLVDHYQAFIGLHTLVYDCGKDISFAEYSALPEYDRLQLLLDDASPNSVADLLQARAQSQLAVEKKLWKEGKCRGEEGSLLGRWLRDQSEAGRLGLVAGVAKASKPTLKSTRLITDDTALLTLALDCLYACPIVSAQTWAQMSEIYESLPEREAKSSELVKELQDRVDHFEKHLAASEILHKYELAKPIKTFLLSWTDENSPAVVNLLLKLTQRAIRSQPAFTTLQWRELLKDLTYLCEKAFPFLEADFALTEFFRALLKTPNFALAQEYIGQVANAEEVVLSVATEFFNSCSSVTDPSISRALDCLKLLKSANLDVRKEMALIEGIRKLYQLGLHDALPLRIRLSKDRLEFIHQLLKNSPTAYQELGDLLETASLLGRGAQADKNAVRLVVAETAFEQEDYWYCYHLCTELMTYQYTHCWTLCKNLALSEHFKSLDDRLKLLAYVLQFAPKKELQQLLAYWRTLEVRQQAKSVGVDQDSVDQTIFSIVPAVSTKRALTPSKLRNSASLSLRSDSLGASGGSPLQASSLNASELLTTKFILSDTNCEQFLHVCMQRLLELDSSPLLQTIGNHHQAGGETDWPDTYDFYDFYRSDKRGLRQNIYNVNQQHSGAPGDELLSQVRQQLFHLTTLTMAAGSSRKKIVRDLALTALKKRDVATFVATLFAFERREDITTFLEELGLKEEEFTDF